MREVASLEALRALAGTEVAVSDWVEISQQRVNTFADATGDHQWIHVDVERCKRESPFGGTIAHGFLTVSLLPAMLENALSLPFLKMGLNYGLNKLRFTAPVAVGSRLRARMTLQAIDDIDGGAQLTWGVLVDADGSAKPACVAEFLVRVYA
ncbi:MAG TPA: MaoC family dehydratase [Telluria sp.]|nr:MaoC family dehydratase [Telluria sp.]